VHIPVLLLGGVAPEANDAFLYSPEGNYRGEAANLLDALRISSAGRSADAILTEVQKRGLFLTYVLQCPLEPGVNPADAHLLLEKQLPAVTARIRRSLKPRRVVLFSRELANLAEKLTEATIGSLVFTGAYGPFSLDGNGNESDMEKLRGALSAGSLV